MSDSIFRKDGTAQGVAKQRLIESLAKPEQRIINDPFAYRFVMGAIIVKLIGHKINVWLSRKFVPGFHEHLISRTRFIDDMVETSAANHVEQYVILGAGYDLRAHRLNLPSTLKIFEIDQIEVQSRKQTKLPKNIPNVQNITYVSIDFNHETLGDQLLNAGFDPYKSTVFTLEGVSQYITKKAVDATLTEINNLTKSSTTFYISYVDKFIIENPQACFGKGYPNPAKKAETILKLSAKVGEPWISFYSNEEIQSLLSKHGFTVMENKTLEDLNPIYFKPAGRLLPEDHIFNLEHSVVAKK
ncbi:SAM-dependent methyltransferase [Prolixibacteraceae bacterium]|nr:SAM-dependent methyltransferase [Prolixibacteraceae bacterium]